MPEVSINGKQYEASTLTQRQLPNGSWNIFHQQQFLDNVVVPFPDVPTVPYVAPDPVSKPSLPVFGVAWRPHVSKWTNIAVIVRISCPSGATGQVNLLSNADNPPTRQVDRARLAHTETVTGAVLSGSLTPDFTLRHRVPPGHYCRLVTASVTGAPVFSVVDYTLVEDEP